MTKNLFKNKNFYLLWSSQVLSQATINLMNFLVLVHIFDETGSTIASSFIWVAYGIPAVLLGPIAAAGVDLGDKRKILFFSNIFQAAAILFYAFLYQKFLYLSYGVVLAYSILDQFYVPAEAASLPTIISKDNLPKANGLFFITAQGSAILGFGLAGLVKEAIGFTPTMLLGTFLLVVAAIATYYLPKLKSKDKFESDKLEAKVEHHLVRMKEGFGFIWRHKQILFPFLFMIILQVYLAIIVVNLPALGSQIIRTKSSFVGVVTILPAGVGALLGTTIVTRMLSKNVRKRKIVENFLLLGSFAFILIPLAVPILEFWLGRLVLISLFFLIGISFVGLLIPSLTFMQLHTPERLLGRVFGNFWFLAYVATLIPVLFSATITEVLGIRVMLFIMGFITLSIFVFAKARLSKILANF